MQLIQHPLVVALINLKVEWFSNTILVTFLERHVYMKEYASDQPRLLVADLSEMSRRILDWRLVNERREIKKKADSL